MISFAHNNGDLVFKRGTFALELPNREFLENMFKTHGTATLMRIGHTRVSKLDPFIKKTGRELAISRMDWHKVHLQYVEISGTKHVWHFKVDLPTKSNYSNNGIDSVVFGVTTVAESEHANLVYCHFVPNDIAY